MKQTQEYKQGGQALVQESTLRAIGSPSLSRPASLDASFQGFDFEDFKRFAHDVCDPLRIGTRWINKRNGLTVMIREVNRDRNSIRLQEPSSCYTERLSDFVRDFTPEVTA